MKLLVTGANGQLGSELKVLSLSYTKYEWVFTDIDEFDITNLEIIEKTLTKFNPDYVINCAAYTNVDQAEINKEIANLINHKSIAEIAKWCERKNSKLIHISTDYVFDGTSTKALNEESKTNPINHYGNSKLLGDIACRKQCPNSIILRTSWVYSSYGNNFVKTMMRLMTERDELNIINDQIGSPTYARDLAETILNIVEHKNWIPGIYNYSNEGEISWYDFAISIKNINGFKIHINPIKSEEYKTLAKRPKYSLLDKTKIKNTYNIEVPNYLESLHKCITILNNEK